VLFDGVFECGIPPAEIVAEIQTWMFVGIKTLAGINFITEPLGAEIQPRQTLDFECGLEPDCCDPEFEICNRGDTLPGCPSGDPACGPASVIAEPVPAFVDRGCDVPLVPFGSSGPASSPPNASSARSCSRLARAPSTAAAEKEIKMSGIFPDGGVP
jgi:hypothetical protein